MDDSGTDFRRSIFKDILKEDLDAARNEIACGGDLKKISVIHLPSSTLQFWRKSYMWVKSIAMLMLMFGGIGFIWSTKEILTGSLLGAVGFIAMTVGAVAITYIIDMGERELGLWRYERVGSIGWFPKFEWRFVSFH